MSSATSQTSGLSYLRKANVIIIFLIALFAALYFAASVLAPVAVAVLLAMLLTPMAAWLEKHGVHKIISALLSVFVIIAFFAILAFTVGYQVKSVSEKWPEIKERLMEQKEKASGWLKENTPFNVDQVKSVFKSASQSPKGESGMLSSVSGAVGQTLLMLVYVFCFVYYRQMFWRFILHIVPDRRKDQTKEAIDNISHVAQDYLVGKLILIVVLGIVYSIGLSLSGVKYAVVIALLAAVLTLIPYFGNIIGFVLAAAMVLVSGGGMSGILGVAATFTFTQFAESYVLQPLVVGQKVNLNPFFTIFCIIVGNMLGALQGPLLPFRIWLLLILFLRISSLSALFRGSSLITATTMTAVRVPVLKKR